MSTTANLHSKRKKHPAGSRSKPVAGTSSASMHGGEYAHNEAIAVRAYYHALERGFDPGHELDDWLTAEQEECHGH